MRARHGLRSSQPDIVSNCEPAICHSRPMCGASQASLGAAGQGDEGAAKAWLLLSQSSS